MEIKYDEKNEIDMPVFQNLEENIDALESMFADWDDIVKKKFVLEREGGNLAIYIIYIDGLTDNEMVERTITRPLLFEWRGAQEKKNPEDVFRQIFHDQTEAVDLTEKTTMMDTIDGVLKGDTAIFIDGVGKSMVLSTKKLPTRSISNPEKEAGLKGPRDSFNENFRMNTALLRRRIKDPKMKLKQGVLGQRSRTVYGLMYLEDLVYPSLLKKIEEKLRSFTIDGIFDSGMLVHLLEEKWYSPFPQVQTTERPDKAASAIMEGRVVLVVDNSPEVIILPTTLNTFLQAADDYYNRFAVGTFARCLRYLAAYITVLLPGLYVAITCYYPQVLPTDFLLAIVGARNDVTFPIVVEVLLMELLFELLREAGIRLPGQMGNTIGVVGGLIVGQAAVEASLVSTIVVIVVALTAIASFAIPNEEFSSTFRLLKFATIFLGAVWGLYGILLGILVVQIHLASLESFGIPYMMPLVSGSIDDELEFQDFVMRKPIFTMHSRPLYTKRGERTRFRRR
ncbi:MAG: spore germination protein [Lachnospiraceae bacterium]